MIMQIIISMRVNPLFMQCTSMYWKRLHLLHIILIPKNVESCYDKYMKVKDITLEELLEVIRNVVREELKKLVKEDIRAKVKRLMEALKE